MTPTQIGQLRVARRLLLHVEDALEAAGYGEMAFEMGLKADLIAEYIAEATDDGGMTE